MITMDTVFDGICWCFVLNIAGNRTKDTFYKRVLSKKGKDAAPDVGLEPTTLGLLEHDWLAL